MRIVEGPYLRDILDQPRTLRETHGRLTASPALEEIAGRLGGGGFRRVVLSGMGSSLHGLVPLRLQLVEAGHTALAVECSELLHYERRLLDADTLLVLVSQSGRSAEIVRLLEAVRGSGVTTVGVTNTPASPLAQEATACLMTHAGLEATVACKTYLCIELALGFLGCVLCDGEQAACLEALATAASATEGYLAAWQSHVRELAALLEGVRAVFFTGRGPSLAAALSAGLITKESTHRPAEGMSSAAFRHGPMEMLDATLFLLVFAGDARARRLNQALVEDARAASARAHLVAEDAPLPALRLPTVPDLARPVVELLPVEMVTLALAALDEREAGRFERATKVTATE